MRKPSSSSDAGGADDDAAGRSGGGGGAKSTPCCSKVGLKKGPWTPEEDDVLANYIKTEGEGRWRTLPKRAGLLRCGKSCRLRWMNYLRPCVKRGQIAPDEEDLILRLHRLLGNRWSLIAGRIPGRTDNEIKNYWNTHLSKKLISQGIDPRTHKPLDVDVQFRNSKSIVSKDLTELSSPKHSTPPNPKFGADDPKSEPNNSTGVEITDAQIAPHPQTPTEFGFDPTITNNIPNRSPPGSLEEEDNDPNYCTEDVFSTFLNSLINEDLYTCQNQQQIVPNNYDALLAQPASSPASLAFGSAGWDPPPLMSNVATTGSALHHNPSDHDHHHRSMTL